MDTLIQGRDLGWMAYWTIIQAWRRFPPEARLKHSLSLSRLCARIWLNLSPAERRQSMNNLQTMLDGKCSAAELQKINFEHHAAHVWAFLVPDVLPFMSQEQIRQMGEVRGLENLEAALSAGHGAVMLSAHYGSHGYLIIALLAAYGVPVTAVAGREATPLGQDEPEGSWVYRKIVHPVRESPRSAVRMLTKSLVPDLEIAAVLRRNEVLWVQGDMHLTEEDIARERQIATVPFLWGKAPFRTGPVRLPKIFRSPVLPTFGFRQGTHLVVDIEKPLEMSPGGSPADAAADLRAYLDRLEPRILAAPDQWAFTRHENLLHWVKPL